MEKYFKYRNGSIEVARKELLLVKEFYDLLQKFKSPDEQVEIFKYIFLVADRNSHLIEEGLSDSQVRSKALKESKLSKKVNIKELEPAIERYKQINSNKPSVKIYLSMLKTFKYADTIINILQDEVENKIKLGNLEMEDRIILLDLLTKLLDLGKRIPKDMESLTLAYNTMRKDVDASENLLRGDVEFDESMLPDI